MSLELKPEVLNRGSIRLLLLKTGLFILCFCFSPDHSAQTLKLQRNTDTFQIRALDDLTLLIEKKGLKHDSVEMMIRGKLSQYKNGTLFMAYDEYAIHNYYHQSDDSLHYVYEALQDTTLFTKVKVSDIYGIYRHRTRLTTSMTKVVFVSLGLGMVTMPFVLTLKPGTAYDVVSAVNLTSATAMLTSAAVGIIFAKKKFWIRPKDKRSWNVVP